MDEIIMYVLNNSVAIGVMVYFLISIKPSIDRNTEMLGKISEVMDNCQIKRL